MTPLRPVSIDANELARAVQRLGVSLTPDQLARLVQYAGWMWAWNERINLTRHTEVGRFVERDVWDSWQLAHCLDTGEEILDVGSGGGIPGLLLAVLRPDLHVSVSDSIAKKAGVLDDLVERLELAVPVYHGRAEEVIEEFRFDSLVARGVGPLAKVAGWFAGKWHLFERLLLVKGPRWPEERGEARHRGILRDVELRRIHHYPMIGTGSESVVLQLRRKPAPDDTV